MKKFEYNVLEVPTNGFWSGGGKIDAQQLMEKLNELGQQGWELTSSVDLNMAQGQSRSVIIMLKREIQ
ncbi:DUF4177 domain-containing protein [Spirosoma terrae]|jgi:hypothetical protein|uniref:DUF4177 domain-containing protein n=1 Tax=Spirosoma terrae TaxID=1968276 RepID=A0A6L9L0X3_9BACT|nr:DUF4177 domain-containing protein [Spirosoma terrae]NDU94146.1 DUF4177 domain-containing protein [Spirosoma terrae]